MESNEAIFSGRIFSDLHPDIINELYHSREIRTLKKGEFLYKEGIVPYGVYIVNEGYLKCFNVLNSGKQQIIYLAKRGDLLGYQQITCDKPYDLSAVAISNSKVSYITKKTFLNLVKKDSTFSIKVFDFVCDEIVRLQTKIKELGFKKVKHKVASTLLLLLEEYSDKHLTLDHEIYLPLTQEELGCFIGAESESVNKCLSEFVKNGLIKKEGKKIILLNPERIRMLANG